MFAWRKRIGHISHGALANSIYDCYRAKISTARFYSEHILPQAGGLANQVVNGAGSVMALSETQF